MGLLARSVWDRFQLVASLKVAGRKWGEKGATTNSVGGRGATKRSNFYVIINVTGKRGWGGRKKNAVGENRMPLAGLSRRGSK